MITLEERKKHMKYIIDQIDAIKNKIKINDSLFAFFIIIAHTIFIGCGILYLLLCSVDQIYFIFIAFWILLLFFHFYFNGCFLTRIERYYLKNDKWYGPPTLPFLLIGYPISKNEANNVIYVSSFLITATIMVKLFLYLY
tara:strand:+ start:811 stop:1230 length:420 start_codon:yes stop_codon:yes gene_type:complete